MKLKCKVCGKRFIPCKETTYQCQEELTGLAALGATNRIYDATDCPRCGRQVLLGIRVPRITPELDEVEVDDSTGKF